MSHASLPTAFYAVAPYITRGNFRFDVFAVPQNVNKTTQTRSKSPADNLAKPASSPQTSEPKTAKHRVKSLRKQISKTLSKSSNKDTIEPAKGEAALRAYRAARMVVICQRSENKEEFDASAGMTPELSKPELKAIKAATSALYRRIDPKWLQLDIAEFEMNNSYFKNREELAQGRRVLHEMIEAFEEEQRETVVSAQERGEAPEQLLKKERNREEEK